MFFPKYCIYCKVNCKWIFWWLSNSNRSSLKVTNRISVSYFYVNQQRSISQQHWWIIDSSSCFFYFYLLSWEILEYCICLKGQECLTITGMWKVTAWQLLKKLQINSWNFHINFPNSNCNALYKPTLLLYIILLCRKIHWTHIVTKLLKCDGEHCLLQCFCSPQRL